MRGKLRQLALWMRDQDGCIKTSDVVEWGVENFYVSAVRAACLLAERGYLRRLTDDEVHSRFGRQLGQGVWVTTDLIGEI